MLVKFQLDIREAHLILNALAKLPLEQSIETWFKVKAQVEQQTEPPTPEPAKPAEAEQKSAEGQKA